MQSTLGLPDANRPIVALHRQFAVCFLAFVLIGANDGAIGVLLPSLMGQYNVDKAGISLLFLTATLGYLIAAFGSGLLVERLGRQAFLVLGASLFLLGTITLVLQPPFLLFLLALFFVGAGGGTLDAGLNAYVASLPNNTAALNYLHAFYGVGALLGPLAASAVLAVGLGWNITYLLWSIIAVLVLAGFASVLDNARPVGGGSGNVMMASLRLSLVWMAAAFLFLYVGTEVSLGAWSYSFLLKERHGLALFSAWSVSGYWVGLTAGRLVLGRLSSRLGNRRLIELCLIGVVLGVLVLWLAPSGLAAALGLALIGFSLGPLFPTVIALISDRLPARLQTSAIGFVAAGGSVGGAFFPLVIGNLAQALGIWTLMPYTIGLTMVMLALWLVLSRGRQSIVS